MATSHRRAALELMSGYTDPGPVMLTHSILEVAAQLEQMGRILEVIRQQLVERKVSESDSNTEDHSGSDGNRDYYSLRDRMPKRDVPS
jgi:hypothetical protein